MKLMGALVLLALALGQNPDAQKPVAANEATGVEVAAQLLPANRFCEFGPKAYMVYFPIDITVTNARRTPIIVARRLNVQRLLVGASDGRTYKGHVDSVAGATGPLFSVLPPENATGNFVKVVQRVPVKIVFDEAPADLERMWAGDSVEPKVDVRDRSVEPTQRAEPLPPAILGTTDGTGVAIR